MGINSGSKATIWGGERGRRYHATVRLNLARGQKRIPKVESASVVLFNDREAAVRLKACPAIGTTLQMDVQLLEEADASVVATVRGRIVDYTSEGDCLVSLSPRSRLHRKSGGGSGSTPGPEKLPSA